LSADGARWNDGAGTLNFTWLRAAITPRSSFESVGVYEAAAEDVSVLQLHASTAFTSSFFAKKPEKEDEDDTVVQGREALRRRMEDAKKLADSKMKMSESVHTWVLCPFRSEKHRRSSKCHTLTMLLPQELVHLEAATHDGLLRISAANLSKSLRHAKDGEGKG
jgi:hypothetical protein